MRASIVYAILAIVIIGALFLFLIQRFARKIFVYTLRDQWIEITFLNSIRLRHINYGNVSQVSVVTWQEALLNQFRDRRYIFCERWGNILFTSKLLLIEKKKWLLAPAILMTPDNPDDFAAAINKRIIPVTYVHENPHRPRRQ